MSVAIGASRRRGPRLHRDRQPRAAVHGGGRLQRQRARTAHRHDARQPGHRRPHQHLERPLRRHGAARRRLDPAVRRDQPGGRRPAHPGLPPRRGALRPRHGLHGRVHPHPCHRAGRPSRPRSRWTPSCRPTSPARCSTRQSPSPSAPWSAPRRSTRCATWRTPGSSRRWTVIPRCCGANSRARFGREPGGLVHPYRTDDADTVVVAHGLGARDDQGRRRRAARRGHRDRCRRASRSFRPFPIDAVRQRSRRARARSSSSRRPSASASAGCSPTDVAHGAHAARRSAVAHGRRGPRRPADHQSLARSGSSRRQIANARSA